MAKKRRGSKPPCKLWGKKKKLPKGYRVRKKSIKGSKGVRLICK